MSRILCPICQHPAALSEISGSKKFDCYFCGVFVIANAVTHNWFHARKTNGGKLDAEQQKLLPYLSAATRRAETPLVITVENWEGIAEDQRRIGIDDKLRSFLRVIATRSATPGAWVPIHPQAGPALVGARDSAEFDYLVKHLRDVGCIENVGRDVSLHVDDLFDGQVPGYCL